MKSWSDSGATSEPSPRPQPKPPGTAVPEATPQEKASSPKRGASLAANISHTHTYRKHHEFIPKKLAQNPFSLILLFIRYNQRRHNRRET